jgi:hypothetical protein
MKLNLGRGWVLPERLPWSHECSKQNIPAFVSRSNKVGQLTLPMFLVSFSSDLCFPKMGIGAPSQKVKRPGREADHSPPASAKIKKLWIYRSIPPYAFME